MLSVLLSDRLSVSVRVSVCLGYDTAVSVCLYISLLSGRRLSVILLVVSYLLCSPSVLAVRLWWWSVCVISFIYVSVSLSVLSLSAVSPSDSVPVRLVEGCRLVDVCLRCHAAISVSESVSLSTYMPCPSVSPPSVWLLC